MEKLCQLFEAGSERVDLSDLPPHLISSCLKLYFRQVGREREGERDFAPFKFGQIPLWTMDYSPWGSKIESAQKIHASRS